MLYFSWLPKVGCLHSKMWPWHLASGMIFPSLCSCFIPSQGNRAAYPRAGFTLLGGYVPTNPAGSILAYQNWCLPDWMEKGNLHSQAVEHPEHLNLQHGVEVQSLFSFALSFHQPGSVELLWPLPTRSPHGKDEERCGENFCFKNVPQFQDLG